MMGEQLRSAYFTEHGMLGDRAYALIDRATGKSREREESTEMAQSYSASPLHIASRRRPRGAIPPVVIAAAPRQPRQQ